MFGRKLPPFIEPTAGGTRRPLTNAERITLYRARIDETSEYHRERELAGLSVRARWGLVPRPACHPPAFYMQSRTAEAARRPPVAAAPLIPPPAPAGVAAAGNSRAHSRGASSVMAVADGNPPPSAGPVAAAGDPYYQEALEYALAAAAAELSPFAT